MQTNARYHSERKKSDKTGHAEGRIETSSVCATGAGISTRPKQGHAEGRIETSDRRTTVLTGHNGPKQGHAEGRIETQADSPLDVTVFAVSQTRSRRRAYRNQLAWKLLTDTRVRPKQGHAEGRIETYRYALGATKVPVPNKVTPKGV